MSVDWELVARSLFQILDDIDTASDIAKGNNALYRELVRNAHQKRFYYAETDGYTVTFHPHNGEKT